MCAEEMKDVVRHPQQALWLPLPTHIYLQVSLPNGPVSSWDQLGRSPSGPVSSSWGQPCKCLSDPVFSSRAQPGIFLSL